MPLLEKSTKPGRITFISRLVWTARLPRSPNETTTLLKNLRIGNNRLSNHFFSMTNFQFEKFQAFAAQLTQEAQELKSKIEKNKRETHRLTLLIDEQKVNAAHLQKRLDRTERQRDDALEALAMAQELTEQLESDRTKLKTELAGMRDANDHTLSQRDDALKVVLHLRKLIDGQAHLLEDIVQTLPQEIAVEADTEADVDAPAQPSLKPALDRLAVPTEKDRSTS